MLAGSYVAYIIIRTQLNTTFAPLPANLAEDGQRLTRTTGRLVDLVVTICNGAVAVAVANKLGAGAVEQTAALLSSTLAMSE